MLDQPGNCPAQVNQEKFGAELGKVPFHGQLRNCAGAYHIQPRN